MSYDDITTHQEGPILRLTLNRPAKLNAISRAMLREIREAVTAAAEDPESRVVLLDSASDRAFCAGIDVAYVKDLDAFGTRQVGRELHSTFYHLRTTEIPVVCVIDGLCLGAGLEMALSCDFMICSDRATFGLPNIHRGIPAIVEAALLPIAVGLQGARELCYLGENWNADKALLRGLVNKVVAPQELAAEAEALCLKLADKSPLALGTQKEIIHAWMTTDVEAAIEFSINTVVLNWLTDDQKEGMGSFLEGREATFKGT
jgi:enoyl-CoA hydratase